MVPSHVNHFSPKGEGVRPAAQTMKNRVVTLFVMLLVALVASVPVQAQSGLDSIIPAQPTDYVTDVANVVNAETEAVVNNTLRTLQDSSGVNMAVVVLPSLGGYSRDEVALQIGRRWGVASANDTLGNARRNAGLVMLIAPKETNGSGQCKVEVTNTVNQYITAREAAEVCRSMVQDFKRQDYGAGIIRGVGELMPMIYEGQAKLSTTPTVREAEDEGSGALVLVLLIGVVSAIVALIGLITRSPRRNSEQRSYDSYSAPKRTSYSTGPTYSSPVLYTPSRTVTPAPKRSSGGSSTRSSSSSDSSFGGYSSGFGSSSSSSSSDSSSSSYGGGSSFGGYDGGSSSSSGYDGGGGGSDW